jgi:hypothetical protein
MYILRLIHSYTTCPASLELQSDVYMHIYPKWWPEAPLSGEPESAGRQGGTAQPLPHLQKDDACECGGWRVRRGSRGHVDDKTR